MLVDDDAKWLYLCRSPFPTLYYESIQNSYTLVISISNFILRRYSFPSLYYESIQNSYTSVDLHFQLYITNSK